jgi:NADH-quinone oxidoreductase subunit H
MMIVNSCLIVTLFFGGWTLGMFGIGLTTDVLRGMGTMGGFLGAAIFITKVMLFLLMYVWFRATFPRFRFDQLMDLGWKFMIPLALANIFVTGIFILVGQERLMYWIGIGVIGAAAFYLFRPKRAAAKATTQKVAHAG